MKLELKALEAQTVVITGASSGIGLVTARKAAAKGARLVLASRSEAALRNLADEINVKEVIYGKFNGDGKTYEAVFLHDTINQKLIGSVLRCNGVEVEAPKTLLGLAIHWFDNAKATD